MAAGGGREEEELHKMQQRSFLHLLGWSMLFGYPLRPGSYPVRNHG